MTNFLRTAALYFGAWLLLTIVVCCAIPLMIVAVPIALVVFAVRVLLQGAKGMAESPAPWAPSGDPVIDERDEWIRDRLEGNTDDKQALATEAWSMGYSAGWAAGRASVAKDGQ